MKKRFTVLLFSLILLASCSSGSNKKCTGETCRIGDHERAPDIALVSPMVESAPRG